MKDTDNGGKIRSLVRVLVVDTAGTLLFGLGLFEHFSDHGIVPQSLRFTHYDTVLILVGGALMLWALWDFIAILRRKVLPALNRESEEQPTDRGDG